MNDIFTNSDEHCVLSPERDVYLNACRTSTHSDTDSPLLSVSISNVSVWYGFERTAYVERRRRA